MKPLRALLTIAAAVVALAPLTACRMDVDEMVMNPSSRDEIITRLLEENVAKQNIMNRLTTSEDTKMELAETLLGDNKVKGLAIDKLVADSIQRKEMIGHLMADPTAKGMIVDALLADDTVRAQLQEALKKPAPKK